MHRSTTAISITSLTNCTNKINPFVYSDFDLKSGFCIEYIKYYNL